MRYRELLAVLGIGLGILGLGFAVWPAVAAGMNTEFVPVTVVGVVAILAAVWGYRARRGAQFLRADPPDVEDPLAYGSPGDDLDVTLRRSSGPTLERRAERREAHKRLRSLAIEVIQVTEDCDRSAAVDLLEEGAWTDDPRAAALFASDPSPTPMRDVLRGLLSERSPFELRATHAIAALETRLEGAA